MNNIKLLTIIIPLFLISCSTTGQLNLSINFPSSSPVLSKKDKTELKKNIAIKNTSLFTDEEIKELFGELEIEIK